MPFVEQAASVSDIYTLNITIEHEKQGHLGTGSDSIIATFRYRTDAGITGTVILFVKRSHARAEQEIANYVAFMAAGLPTPRYYGHVTDRESRKILFLEYLPDIGIDHDDPFGVKAWLSMRARISATSLPVAHLKKPDLVAEKPS